MARFILAVLTASAMALCAAGPAAATTVTIDDNEYNSIFFGAQSNSAGAAYSIYSGKDGAGGGGGGGGGSSYSRGLISFDVSSPVIPADATILSAALTMYVAIVPTQATSATNVSLYRLTDSWGEGTSTATLGMGTGMGSAATPNGATWLDRFYNSNPSDAVSWTAAGGDYNTSTVSDTQSVGITQDVAVTWQSSQLAADVQAWVDGSEPNDGWILIGNESSSASYTTRRFFSSQDAGALNNDLFNVAYAGPQLTITYEVINPVPEPAAGLLLAVGAGILLVGRRRRAANRM